MTTQDTAPETAPATTTQPKAAKPDTKLQSLAKLIEASKDKLASIVPQSVGKVLTGDRIMRVALSALQRTPDLLECTWASLYLAMHHAAQLGLEPGSPLGYYYLTPRKNRKNNTVECLGIIGYRGYCDLARRSGEILEIRAENVYQGEDFSWDKGTGVIAHKGSLTADQTPETLTASWAHVQLRGGGSASIVLPRKKLEQHRDRFAPMKGTVGPWSTDFEAMCRKTAIRLLLSGGTVPLSSELRQALDYEREQDEPIIAAEQARLTVTDMSPPPDTRPSSEKLADKLAAEEAPSDA